MKYLEIKFGDNDFSTVALAATQDLVAHPYNDIRIMTEKQIERIIRRAIVIYSFKEEVIEDWYPTQKDTELKDSISHLLNYFKYIKVIFHNDKSFSEDWNNGESVGVCLKTNYVWIF